MRTVSIFHNFAIAILCVAFAASSCTKDPDSKTDTPSSDEVVASNIAKYSRVWDSIINVGDLDLFTSANFFPNVVFHMKPNNVAGIDSARACYANYLTGFSNIKFEIVNIFGHGDQLTKHWVFSGTHTGNFFGIPPTGKYVSVEGSTIARMENGIIIEEQDFFDNPDLLTQLGVY